MNPAATSLDPGMQTAALELTQSVYRAALEPSRWEAFARELSDTIGGVAVTLALLRPEARLGWDHFGSGVPGLAALVSDRIEGTMRRAADRHPALREGFANLGDAFPRVTLAETDVWRRWLAPAGFSPEWPLCHAVGFGDTIRCWLVLQPLRGRDFDRSRAAALGDGLVPHLRRALSIHAELSLRDHEHRAMQEVLDRLPAGVLLVDAGGSVRVANVAAERMLALDDGIRMEGDRLRARRDHDAEVQEALHETIGFAERGEFDGACRVVVASRSERRPFLLSFIPVLAALPGSPEHDAVVAVFLANPDAMSTASVRALGAVYGLTQAESEVVQGLVEGQSLEEIARARGVTPQTARTQLKQVFAKTGTKRQAELIGLVLSGVSPLAPAGGASS